MMHKHRQMHAWLLLAAFVGGGLLAPSVHFAYMALSERYNLGSHEHERHGTAHTAHRHAAGATHMVSPDMDCQGCEPCTYAKLFFSLHWSSPQQQFSISLIDVCADVLPPHTQVHIAEALLPFSARGPPLV